ncbi:aminomethyltransferase family protein [bacterium]|nr:aminomethyltransferase family protein [bacterium]
MAGRRTPLGSWHEAHGARFIEEGGWEIPAYYSSVEAEYDALGDSAGLIDLCHQGRFKVSGEKREEALNRLVTIDLKRLPQNRLAHCFMCNERGGIIDEVAIYKGDQFFLIHSHGGARQQVHQWLRDEMEEFDVEVADSSVTQGALDIRGPLARSILDASVLDGSPPPEPNTTSIVQIGQARCLVFNRKIGSSQSFEVYAGSLYVESVWERIYSVGSKMGLVPVGWLTLDVLRLEAGVPRYGREIDDDTTPIEIGAAMRVDFTKRKFLGKRALLHSTCGEFSRRLVTLRFDGVKIPSKGDPIEVDGTPVGFVTSGARSPRIDRAIGMGFVDALKSTVGTQLQVRIEDQTHLAVVTESALGQAT